MVAKSCVNCKTTENLINKNIAGRQFICNPCNNKLCKSHYDRSKLKVLEHYGNKCYCCGEDTLLFLTVDHINNDGHEEKWPNGTRITGRHLYSKLVSRGFPPTYQILCANCNHGKRMNNGVCPHEMVK